MLTPLSPICFQLLGSRLAGIENLFQCLGFLKLTKELPQQSEQFSARHSCQDSTTVSSGPRFLISLRHAQKDKIKKLTFFESPAPNSIPRRQTPIARRQTPSPGAKLQLPAPNSMPRRQTPSPGAKLQFPAPNSIPPAPNSNRLIS